MEDESMTIGKAASWRCWWNVGRIALSVVAVGAAMVAGIGRAADATPPAGFTALFNGKDLSGWQDRKSVV